MPSFLYVKTQRSYVIAAMNLLLLLSALLSALTGVGGYARVDAPAAAIERVATAPQAIVRADQRTLLGRIALPPSIQRSAASCALPTFVVPAVPAYLSRRRE